MNTPLNDDTQQKARELARKITVAHDLDPEIQEELYGHIEDKLLAYKSGEERVSDEDAFILVREHFGDAKVIRGLMQEVHADAARYDLVRAFIWIEITMFAAKALAKGAGAILSVVFWLGLPPGKRTEFMSMFTLPIPWLQLVGVFLLLVWWRRNGASPWFLRWPLWRMGLALPVLLLLVWAVPFVGFAAKSGAMFENAEGRDLEFIVLSAMFSADRWVFPFFLCAIWLWWAGCMTQAWKYGLVVCALWACFQAALMLSPVRFSVIVGAGPESHEASHRLAATWSMLGSDMTIFASNVWRGEGVERIVLYFGIELFRATCCLAGMRGIFQLVARSRAESNAVNMKTVQ